MTPRPRWAATGDRLKTLVFLAGFLAVSYGVYVAFTDSLLESAVCVLVGLCLQLASGDVAPGGTRRQLRNPCDVLGGRLRGIRTKVQSWERRQ
jgi:hypothetical protein